MKEEHEHEFVYIYISSSFLYPVGNEVSYNCCRILMLSKRGKIVDIDSCCKVASERLFFCELEDGKKFDEFFHSVYCVTQVFRPETVKPKGLSYMLFTIKTVYPKELWQRKFQRIKMQSTIQLFCRSMPE